MLEATSADQWEELLTSYQELELRSYELHFTQEQNQFILVHSTCFDYLIELNIRSCVNWWTCFSFNPFLLPAIDFTDAFTTTLGRISSCEKSVQSFPFYRAFIIFIFCKCSGDYGNFMGAGRRTIAKERFQDIWYIGPKNEFYSSIVHVWKNNNGYKKTTYVSDGYYIFIDTIVGSSWIFRLFQCSRHLLELLKRAWVDDVAKQYCCSKGKQ